MRIKKLLCMLLTLTLLFSGNVYADEGIGESGTATTNPGDVELQYTNISSIASDLAILSSGTAICTGRHVMKKNLKSELVLTLQRRSTSKDDSFSTYKEWTKSCSGTGSFLLEKKPTVTKGYDYRLRVVVKVYSGSKVTEAAACYSKTVTY